MFQKMFLAITLALFASAQTMPGQPCHDISTVWTLSSTYVDGIAGSAIYSDGLGSYINGQQGVSAVIHTCGTHPTYDATLIPSGAKTPRRILFNFGRFLGTSFSSPPPWTSSGAFASTPVVNGPLPVVNIRNILDFGTVDRSQPYTLYTRLASGFQAPDGNNYHLRMANPNTSGVAPTPNDATANTPYVDAQVVVQHFPATATQKEYWLVYPETQTQGNPSSAAQVGVLLSWDATVNYGQFSMPFYFIISVK